MALSAQTYRIYTLLGLIILSVTGLLSSHLLHAEQATQQSKVDVITPKYLTAEQLTTTLKAVFAQQLTVTPHENKLILSGSETAISQAKTLISELDVTPQAINIFLDFDHTQPIEFKSEQSKKYQTTHNTADISTTGFVNQWISIEIKKEDALAIFPILAFKDVTAMKHAQIKVSPSEHHVWVTLNVHYLSRNSGMEQTLQTKILVQPNEWYILEPEEPEAHTQNNDKKYSTQSRISQFKSAIKVVFK